MAIKVFDRASSQIYIEQQFKAGQLNLLYNSVVGRVLLKLIFATKTYSKLSAVANTSKRSIKKIKPFVEQYSIDMDDFDAKEYTSFNDFFTRKMGQGRRPFSASKDDFIAVADSKLAVYKIDDALKIDIKNSVYTASELVQNDVDADAYKDGVCLVFRLTVDDYHRYCFFDSGKIIRSKVIRGCLHTVGPMSAKRYKVYCENQRVAALLATENFGESLYIEIGALLVGKIINHETTDFAKGDEKGYFSFGGSTVVVLLKENTITIDEDILEYSKQGIETKVKMGEKIGVTYA